jgi:FkbM family methyltransferase
VFDIGANVGEHSSTFLSLGAHVVAVEPNPSCCKRIRALGHARRLTVRCEAVGHHQGEVMLFLGDHSGHSTVSEEWIQKVSRIDSGYSWKSAINCPVITMDRIRQEHGNPDFVKIDVEGYEASVLYGMSFRPSVLSFEFHAFAPEYLRQFLTLPIFESACTFNVALGDSWEFVWPGWRGKEEVINYVSGLPEGVFGDIYSKFDGSVRHIHDRTNEHSC